jgi:hypothetical protein
MPYVLWVAAYNTSFLLGYLILDTLFFHVPGPEKFPYIRRSSLTRDRSPVRSDRGPEFSPTEAAAYSPLATQVSATESSTAPSSPVPRPNRSSSKRALYSNAAENIEGDGTSYSGLSSDQANSFRGQRTPELLEAINLNGLAVFLLVSHLPLS